MTTAYFSKEEDPSVVRWESRTKLQRVALIVWLVSIPTMFVDSFGGPPQITLAAVVSFVVLGFVSKAFTFD